MKPSTNIYSLPLPADAVIEKIVTDSPGHPGPYKGAIDFAVKPGTDVLAPFDGEVITVVDVHNQYGADPKYAQFANYIQIAHANGETSDLMHLARDSATVNKGDTVKRNQTVAKTGLSGYMTAPHLHWFVFVKDGSANGFQGLQIQCEELNFFR